MDKVLIVDSDKENLRKIENGFKELHHFNLLTATDGKTAVDMLQQTKISVLVASMSLAVIDGVELICYMTRNHGNTPCILMLDPGKPKPWFTDRSGPEDLLYFIEKPFEFGALASMIFVGLNLKDEGLTMKGMTLKNFLPVMALSRKTCQMDVMGGGQKKGVMYFSEGVLLDAACPGSTADEAAKTMAQWNSVGITLSALPDNRQVQRIETKLMEIAGASWRHKPTAPVPEKSAVGIPATVKTPSSEKFAATPKSPVPPSKLQESLSRYAGVLKAIKGYLCLAVLNPGGDILAMDTTTEDFDVKAFSPDFNNLFGACSMTVSKKGLERCNALTLHTPKVLILMMTSDVYKQGNYRFIGYMAPDGNGYFFQNQLARLIPQILGPA